MNSIPFASLAASPYNVRTVEDDDEGMDSLASSIIAHGIIEPLVVHKMPRKKHGVLCGSRRWAALRVLWRDKQAGDTAIDFDFDNIPAVIREGTPDELREISLDENVNRRDLRPHEEYAAYAALGTEADAAKIAVRFGKTERHVKQRMRLGRLHPDIFAKLATGQLSLDAAQAYAATDDQAAQLKVFKKNSRKNGGHYAYQIRQDLRGESENRSVQAQLRLVGREAYEAAGGTLTEDLFSREGDDTPIVRDVKLLNRLFQPVYEAKLATLSQMLGGARHVTEWRECGARYTPPTKPLPDDLEAEYAALEKELSPLIDQIRTGGYENDEDRASLVSMQAAITARLREIDDMREMIFPEDKPLVFTSSIADDGRLVATGLYFEPEQQTEQTPVEDRPKVEPAPVVDPGPNITKKAQDALALGRRQILIELFDDNDPRMHGGASKLLLFSLARARYGHRDTDHLVNLGIGEGPPPAFVEWDWFKEEDENEAFRLFYNQDDAAIESVAQQLIGRMIRPHRETSNGILGQLGHQFLDNKTIRARHYWEPTADFFSLFSVGVIAGLVAEIDEDQGGKVRKMKRTDAIDYTVKLFNGELAVGEDLKAKALAWVPGWLMFHVEQPPEPDTGDAAEPTAQEPPAAANDGEAAEEAAE